MLSVFENPNAFAKLYKSRMKLRRQNLQKQTTQLAGWCLAFNLFLM